MSSPGEADGRSHSTRRLECPLSGVKRTCRLGPGMSPSDPSPTSPLRHPGYAHALTEALLSSEINRIVAYFGGAQAADRKAWVERKSRFRSSSCLIQRAEQA